MADESRLKVVIAGNMGAGKSTLLDLLVSQRGIIALKEPVKNRFLDAYWSEPARWGFHVQVEFMVRRTLEYTQRDGGREHLFSDRSLHEDRFIFVELLKAQGELSEEEYSSCLDVYHALLPSYFEPDAIIFLTAPIDVLLARVRQRQEVDFECSEERLRKIGELYEALLNGIKTPILKIDTSVCDLATDIGWVQASKHIDGFIKS